MRLEDIKAPIRNYQHGTGPVITMRCPSCGKEGTFEKLNNINDLVASGAYYSQRRCPNTECHCHVFIISKNTGEIMNTYPPERIDFEKRNIPQNILHVFEEAISCHANKCYKASAMMVRRTLEEICHDKGIKDGKLCERLQEFKKSIIIPQELFDGMDELRLLGNDAAHIEARFYDEIGEEEIEISIEFTKEILKAIYQYQDLLTRMKSLKKHHIESK